METKIRSSIKSIIWRLVGILVLAIVTFLFTKSWIQTTWITFLHHGIFLFVYYFHERFYTYVTIQGFKRKLIKMVTYETILGNFILGIITLIIIGDVQKMTQITITYIAIKHLLYMINEIWWEKIKWQKN